jgi:hypothetical protein
MRAAPHRNRAILTPLLVFVLLPAPSAAAQPPSEQDPLAHEIARLREFAADPPADDDLKGILASLEPVLDDAATALANGRRWVALSRVALVWSDAEAAMWLGSLPAERQTSMDALEEEWRRAGAELTPLAEGVPRPDFDGIPAAARAVGEAALSEVRALYDASREYGGATSPKYGLFYLGAAKAQLELAKLAPALGGSAPPGKPLSPRSVAREIDALERELLAAYVPPLSIEEHPWFIRSSGQLKQARELDAAGLRHGALYRMLQARLGLSRIVHRDRSIDLAVTEERARAFEAGLAPDDRDPTLARMFVEAALVAAANPDPAARGGAIAAAVFEDVLPLYRRTLGPPPPPSPPVTAEVTVTLVRWPYT